MVKTKNPLRNQLKSNSSRDPGGRHPRRAPNIFKNSLKCIKTYFDVEMYIYMHMTNLTRFHLYIFNFLQKKIAYFGFWRVRSFYWTCAQRVNWKKSVLQKHWTWSIIPCRYIVFSINRRKVNLMCNSLSPTCLLVDFPIQ